MSDVFDGAFIVPYPPENVYGLGIAGPPPPERAPEPAEIRIEDPPLQQNTEFIEDEEVGQNVDIKV